MTTKHFVLGGDAASLSKVKGGKEFAPDGTRVISVTLSDDETHLLNIDGGSFKLGDGGTLQIHAGVPQPVRVYGSWLYAEWLPYVAPKPARVRVI